MSFVKRKIDLVFQLGQGVFGESGTNTVTCSGLRVHAHITGCFGPGNATAQITAYGLTPSLLNQLSALNQGSIAIRKNTIVVSAGDDTNGMATVFQGQIMLSQIQLNTSPDTGLVIAAQTGAFAAVQRVDPSSYPGTADVAVIMQNLAYEANLEFENNGVSVILATPYLYGDPREKIRKCWQAGSAHFNYVIDSVKNVLAIFPVGGSRGGAVPVISPETGMVGYPGYSTGVYGGLAITTLFNPLLRPGGVVQVKSSLEVANGQWGVYELEHELSSEDPGSPWFTRFTGECFMVSEGYNGFQRPSSASTDFNAIQFLVQSMMNGMATATLVQVKGVTNSGGVEPVGFVDIQPMVNLVDGIGTAVPHGTIYRCPYNRLQGGANAIIMDPEVGDIGVAVFADRDISSATANKSPSNPGSSRRFDMADGLYLGGFLNAAPTQYVQFSSAGITLFSPNMIQLQAQDIRLIAPTVEINASTSTTITTPTFTVNGNQVNNGNVTATGTVLAPIVQAATVDVATQLLVLTKDLGPNHEHTGGTLTGGHTGTVI